MRRCLALVACLAAPAHAAGPHPFSVHDLVALERVSEPQVSPDGRQVAFVVRATDLEANRGNPDLWLVGMDGSGLRQLTTHETSDNQPRWSAEGESLWFLSTRSGSSQVWRIPIAGGEARQVTDLSLDVGSFALSRDGRSLALAIEVFPDCDTLACTRERLDSFAERKTTARVYDRLFVRHWDTWKDGRRSHLFVMPAEGGEPVDVMRGMDADCPSKPFGGPEEYTFTPDGRGVVFTARDVGAAEAWSTDFDLYLAPVDGTSAPRCLTEPNEAWDTNPVFSPDGKTLAWLAMREPGYESDRRRIQLRPWPEGATRVISEAWDSSPETLTWSSDGSTLLATADHLGQHPLFAIDVTSGRVRMLAGEGHVASAVPAGARVVIARDDLRSPAELYSIGMEGEGLVPLTRINAERLAQTRLGQAEPFTFSGWNGETVHGWVVRPAEFDPARRYPVAFLIHGGPQGSFGNHFHYRWNPQTYSGAGYAAVMVDFHGSTGYGQAFTDSIRGDWGGKPLVDLQQGLEAALGAHSWMDPDRVSALGASFGGYMVNWIAGKWPDRFRCLVSHDGNLDERAAYFNTEELWFPERDHEGTPWTNPAGYAKHNPVDLVDRWRTPMLVIHGALDFRVVDTQGLATFNALQRRGIPSRFVHFPDENHWVLKPHNSIFWHETVLDWLARWNR
jgi:dipeptidyl aminopeptidase/acylaminoacyl peptidase